MDLRQLESFVTIVKEGSLSAASKRHHLSQPALSQQLQSLELELGESLLRRHPRGVEPTVAGELLLKHARVMLGQMDRLREDFQGRRKLETGHFSFGIIPTLAPYLLPQLLGPFRKAHPGIMVSVKESRTEQLISMVAEGEIEFAILSGAAASERRHSSLQLSELFREPLLLAAPANHPLATRKALPQIEDVDPNEMIHLSGGHCLAQRTMKIWRECKQDFRLQCDQISTALAMVSGGMGVTIVPKLASLEVRHENIVCRKFAGKGLDRPIHLLKPQRAHLSAAAEKLLAVIVRK